MLDECPRRVNFVEDRVGIPVVATSEYGDLVVGVSSPQTLKEIGSNEDALREHSILAIRCFHLNRKIWLSVIRLCHRVKLELFLVSLRMNQSFVHVKDQELFEACLFELKIDLLIFRNGWELFDLLDDIDRLNYLQRYLFID